MAKLFDSVNWGVLDCVSGAFRVVDKYPFRLASGGDLDLGEEEGGPEVEIASCGGGISLTSRSQDADMAVNGETVHYAELKPWKDYSVKIGGHFLAIRGQRKVQGWPGGVDVTEWTLLDSMTEEKDGPLGPGALIKVAREKDRHRRSIVRPDGLSTGFLLFHLWDELEEKEPAEVKDEDLSKEATVFIGEDGSLVPVFLDDGDDEEKVADSPDAHARLEPDARGRHLCPHCWGKFDEGDILHIAVHESLRGDPLLGPAEMRRYLPRRFDDEGFGLDSEGLPSLELACPHCRLRLPRDFIRIPHKTISVIGDVGAGKTSMMAAMCHSLPIRLKEYGVRYHGQDRYRNRSVKELSQALFGGEQGESVSIEPTTRDGEHYQLVNKAGRRLRLPQPFIFRAENIAERKVASLVIYDASGDDFVHEDGDSVEISEHLAHADGIVFVVDPLRCSGIRKALKTESADERLEDRHGSILDSLRQRLQRAAGGTPVDVSDVPLTVVINKADQLRTLLPKGSDDEPIDDHSGRVKAFLAEHEPELLASCEATSRKIAFFAVSVLGHDPEESISAGRSSEEDTALPWEWTLVKSGLGWVKGKGKLS